MHKFEVLTGHIQRSTLESAAYDLFADADYFLDFGQTVAVGTGVTTRFDPSLVAVIKERSGLALKHGIEIHGGVIDADYRDEWKVIVKYLRKPDVTVGRYLIAPEPCLIKKGDKIAQFLILELPKVELIGDVRLLNAERVGGLGSTGK
jgi:dUTP pyrophosphatase